MRLIELFESQIIKWNTNPNIGWWQESSPLYMYHGTHKSKVDNILQYGLKAPSSGSTANWVSIAFDPNTAFGYASMYGGEAAFLDTSFRDSSKATRPKIATPDERAVLVMKFPNGLKDFQMLGYDESLSGNTPNEKKKLQEKELYISHKQNNGQDHQYYQLCEIRLPKVVDKSWIIGVTYKS